MQVLFVHGMGRSPVSGTPMLLRLARHGHKVDVIGYLAATEKFDDIVERVGNKIQALSQQGEYVLIGHSLGGVLLRAALQRLSKLNLAPKHLFLLGSPINPPRLADKNQHDLGFQLFAGDCGQLLASEQRLASISVPKVPSTIIAGVRDFPLTKKYFNGQPNDGVVALSEIEHPSITDVLEVPVIHTFLPSSSKVSRLILDKLSAIQTKLIL